MSFQLENSFTIIFERRQVTGVALRESYDVCWFAEMQERVPVRCSSLRLKCKIHTSGVA